MSNKEKEELEQKKKKIKRKVAGGAAAGVMAAGLLVNGMFNDPEDMTKRTAEAMNQPAIVQVMDLDADDDNDEPETNEEETAAPGGIFARIKKWILDWPIVVKILIGVPLWAVGWTVSHLFGLLFANILSPVLSVVLKWIIGFVILAIIFAIIMKLIFPDKKLKEILRPRNLLFLLLGAVILGAIDFVLGLSWPDYSKFKWILMFAGGIMVLAAISIPFIIRNKNKAKLAL